MSRTRSTRARRGSISIAVLLLVVICAAVAAGALMSNVGATREAQTLLARERAFQAAEAGMDWALTRMRISWGVLPSTPLETRAVDGTASFEIRYLRGNEDGIDENGDGVVDEAGESVYSTLKSTGISGGVRRTLQATVRRTALFPPFTSAMFIHNEEPILDLDGNSFVISGDEHTLDGTLDATLPPVYGITSLAPVTTLDDQIEADKNEQIQGSGDDPSLGSSGEIDLAGLVVEGIDASTVVLEPGVHGNDDLGTATAGDINVVSCVGDLHLTGGTTGAGILVVQGNLTITGGFEWTGIVLVTGNIEFEGGGNEQRIIGTLVLGGEGIVRGTVDLLYSTEAINLATLGLSIPNVMSWEENTP